MAWFDLTAPILKNIIFWSLVLFWPWRWEQHAPPKVGNSIYIYVCVYIYVYIYIYIYSVISQKTWILITECTTSTHCYMTDGHNVGRKLCWIASLFQDLAREIVTFTDKTKIRLDDSNWWKNKFFYLHGILHFDNCRPSPGCSLKFWKIGRKIY